MAANTRTRIIKRESGILTHECHQHRFRDADGNGPLESVFILSSGAVALMRFSLGNLLNSGLHLALAEQPLGIDL